MHFENEFFFSEILFEKKKHMISTTLVRVALIKANCSVRIAEYEITAATGEWYITNGATMLVMLQWDKVDLIGRRHIEIVHTNFTMLVAQRQKRSIPIHCESHEVVFAIGNVKCSHNREAFIWFSCILITWQHKSRLPKEYIVVNGLKW